MRRHRSFLFGLVAVAAAVVLPLTAAPAAAQQPPPTDPVGGYRVSGADTPAQRSALAARGVDITSARPGNLEIRAGAAQAAQLRSEGLTLSPLPATPAQTAAAAGFPAGYTGYTDYTELNQRLATLASTYPSIVRVSNYGSSYQGRTLPLIKISDNVGTDENEPEVLFTCGQHAREHLTIEMCLRIAERLASGYAGGTTRGTVDSREIWIMPNLNPDGSEYDVATGRFASWRKNRQPNSGSSAIGTDINRNWGYRWGCCGGSSSSPGNETYRGPSAFSSPEDQRVRDFVTSRVVGGRQQITSHIDWHSYAELILWPYGYTTADTGTGLTAADNATFAAIGRAMARTNGYTAEQSSDLYITDGSINDWMWGTQKIWSFTIEMYPTTQQQGGFYPSDTVIARETSRNDAAVDLLLGYADCPPRASGRTC